MTDLVSPEERLYSEKEQFIGLVQRGIPRLHAAVDIGWTPRKLALLLADQGFYELVQTAEEYTTDGIEMVLLEKATGGNMEAVKMWLMNRRPDRWVDKREVKMTGEVIVAQVIVDGTRDGLRAMLEESRGQVIDALVPGGSLDEQVVDAELVD